MTLTALNDIYLLMSNEVQVVQDKRVKIPLNKLIELRSKDVTIEDMAKQFDCTERAIYKRLAQFHTNPIDIKSFADNKEKTLLFMQAELVNSFTKAQINKIPPYHRIVAFGILEDKLKQMSAGSTGNINILPDCHQPRQDRESRAQEQGHTRCSHNTTT